MRISLPCIVTGLCRGLLGGWAPACRSVVGGLASWRLEDGPARLSAVMPLVIGLMLAWGGPAVQASVILFDNLSAGSPNGSSGVSNTVWIAQAFSTTAAGFVLDEVSIRLWNQNGTSGNFELQVWDASGPSGSLGAQVGSAIYTGLAQNLGSSYGSLLTVPSLNVNLAADTDYYLVALGTSLADIPGDLFGPTPGLLYWDQTNIDATDSYFSTSSGGSWTGPGSRNSFMSVTAVPEPSAGIMLAVGLIAWPILRLRQRIGDRRRLR